MKQLKILSLIVVALLVIFYIANRKNVETYTNTTNTATSTNVTSTTTNVSIENFVTKNISSLSPEKEVLGGKFYVTKIQASNGVGTVEYEDGHIALVADFTYETDIAGRVSVLSFTVRK